MKLARNEALEAPALFHRTSLNEDGDLSEAPEHPMAKFLERAELDNALNKDTATTRDPSWDEVIGAAPRVQLSKEFLERSDARLQRVAAKIRTIFGEHQEEAEQAIAIAKSMLHA